MRAESTPLQVVAAVIVEGREVLACRRNDDRALGGKWEFPGGKLERGESLHEALVREVREELDVAIEVGDVLIADTTMSQGLAIRLTCMRASLCGARPSSSTDHDELRWVPIDMMAQLDWAPADMPAVRLLMQQGSFS